MNNSDLEFRKIKSLDCRYEVNSNGTIFRNSISKKQSKIVLDMHHSNTGYYTTWVNINHHVQRVPIHKVVAECFIGPKPEGYEIDHIDRNSRNNDYTNLRYVTKSEQMKNRDHSNISITGATNLERARFDRMKPVILIKDNQEIDFESQSEAARFLSQTYGTKFDSERSKLKKNRSHIHDYDVEYPNC